mgnify:CR=1 FL=1
MKKLIQLSAIAIIVLLTACNSSEKHVQDNITMYSNVWDDIINNGNLELFNTTNFNENITLIMSPENVVGIDAAKAYYANFATGFSNVEFSIVNASERENIPPPFVPVQRVTTDSVNTRLSRVDIQPPRVLLAEDSPLP